MLASVLTLSSFVLIASPDSYETARKISWRAHEVGQKGDYNAIPWLEKTLRSPPSGAERERVLEYVLDALILLDAQVDPSALEFVVASENAALHRRAIILLSANPIGGESVLLSLIDRAELDRTPHLAATEILIASRSRQIATRLLGHLHPALEIVVHDPNMGFGSSYGIGCSGGLGMRGYGSDFPPPARYEIVEGTPEADESVSWRVRLAQRPYELWAQRRSGTPQPHSYGYTMNTDVALDLLAELSGLARKAIELEDEPRKYITWTSSVRYQVEAEAYLRVRLRRYSDLLRKLRGERLLDGAPRPLDYQVSVRDLRESDTPLPEIRVEHVRPTLLPKDE